MVVVYRISGYPAIRIQALTWRQEDVVLLEPFWDSCHRFDCQMAWFKSGPW